MAHRNNKSLNYLIILLFLFGCTIVSGQESIDNLRDDYDLKQGYGILAVNVNPWHQDQDSIKISLRDIKNKDKPPREIFIHKPTSKFLIINVLPGCKLLTLIKFPKGFPRNTYKVPLRPDSLTLGIFPGPARFNIKLQSSSSNGGLFGECYSQDPAVNWMKPTGILMKILPIRQEALDSLGKSPFGEFAKYINGGVFNAQITDQSSSE